MRMSSLVGRTLKEVPKDAQTASHVFLLRGGYARQVSTGIYSLLPLGKRITRKIERLLRDEMDRIDGQEVLMPVVLPRELWEESGRYESVGPELLRMKDRNGKDMLLGMTHEEAVVALARTELTSYKQLPVMMYQIQTKYRDEARPRAGLIRVREFTMKDGYSFHDSQESLETYYWRCHEAYERFFRRVGMKQVVSIESDTGMMGGSKAHEFMAVSEIGEDTIFLSPDGTYRANKEVATSALKFVSEAPLPLESVSTPGQTTIEQVAKFLGVQPSQTGKAVFYRHHDGGLVFVVIRGDLEVNEAKLRRVVQSATLLPASDTQIRSIGSVPGYASPMGVDPTQCRIVFDRSAAESSNLVVGGNEADVHVKNFNFTRDMASALSKIVVTDVAAVRAGDPCPLTGEPLIEARGIEVGNIFQLGVKYSAAMNANYLDEEGKLQPFIMGCYGIGVGRALAAVMEQSRDDNGPIWPISIAPYEVHVVGLFYGQEPVQTTADGFVTELEAAGIEVLLDDRDKKAGPMFADADLIGIPYRIVVSPKGLADGQVEVKSRDGSVNERVAVGEAVARVRGLVEAARRASL
jgi:prolyl-tRNA synthetase